MRKTTIIASVLLLSMSVTATAQDNYPSRPIQIIVPFAAGGGNDLLARTLGDKLQKRWDQPVVVENKPGAGGNIGTEAMLRAPADGYTLLLATNTMAISPHLNKATPYDVRKDFAPIAKLAKTPFVLIVNGKSSPVGSVGEVVSHAKANPGKLTYASVGVGTPHHLGMEMFKAAAKLDMVHVPYRGSPLALTDLLAGQTQLMFATINAVKALIEKGDVKALATPEAKRMSMLSDVPTMTEAGVPGVDFTAWYGVVAKAGTPASVQQKLSQAFLEIISDADTKQKIIGMGFEIAPDDPQETQRLLNSELDKWGMVTRSIGLKPE
jgi:tripartite-type tricarboxylate transporter receptor subunit TctC